MASPLLSLSSLHPRPLPPHQSRIWPIPNPNSLSSFSSFSSFPDPGRRKSLAVPAVPPPSPLPEAVPAVPLLLQIQDLLSSQTWPSSLVCNAVVFALGYPVLQSGLTGPGIASAFALGSLTWRAFGPQGFLLVASYFIIGTAVTKVKIKQKEREGIAEKRSGKRGPASVWGSGTAGSLCALASIIGLGGPSFAPLWQLGFTASFCTKLNDTVSSEIGKAFGKTTYLITSLKIVPRGTEGAVSLEGTLAGVVASILVSALATLLHLIDIPGACICIVSSQLANVFESFAGALLQDQKGYEWLNNDVVNVMNISLGAAFAIGFAKLAS